VKLCRDCRYYGANVNQARIAASTGMQRPWIPAPGSNLLCLHPNAVSEIDPTTGETHRMNSATLAYNQRQIPKLFARVFNRCGSAARWFDPKEVA